MFESLSTVLKSANVEKINFSVSRANIPDHIQVVIQSTFYPSGEQQDEVAQSLRARLSQPVVVSGYVGEVDLKLESVFLNHIEAVIPSIDSLSVVVPEVDVMTEEKEKEVVEKDFTTDDVCSL